MRILARPRAARRAGRRAARRFLGAMAILVLVFALIVAGHYLTGWW
jgi:hypothetical protein